MTLYSYEGLRALSSQRHVDSTVGLVQLGCACGHVAVAESAVVPDMWLTRR